MAKSEALINELKTVLRERGMTYSTLAQKLEISEASVKRIFSKCHCSLERLDEICDVVEMDVTDIAKLASITKATINHLTEEQEIELVKNKKLLLVAACARNHWSFDQIINQYQLSEPECIQLLAHLDRIHFLELLPNNRIKLLVATDFRWLPNGPVERFYAKNVEKDFFNFEFSSAHAQRIFLSGGLSEQSLIVLSNKIKALAREFQELHQQDFTESFEEKSNHAMVIALRPWELTAFKELRK